MSHEIVTLNSLVEFYLIGTVNNKRTVLAKSTDANVDLKSYASISYLFEKNKKVRKSILAEIFYFQKIELEPLKIDSQAFQFYVQPELDSGQRLDNLTFVWRGLASSTDKLLLKDLFDERSHNLFEALYLNNKEQFEWDLSDIISACDLTTKNRKLVLSKKKMFYKTILYLYGILFLLMMILTAVKIAFQI